MKAPNNKNTRDNFKDYWYALVIIVGFLAMCILYSLAVFFSAAEREFLNSPKMGPLLIFGFFICFIQLGGMGAITQFPTRLGRYFVFMSLFGAFACVATGTAVFFDVGINCEGLVIHDLGRALYFSIVTFSTLGYGDCHPIEGGRATAAVLAISGLFSFGLYIAMITQVALNDKYKNK